MRILKKTFYWTNSLNKIHTIFSTDWRDAPECVWLHPHRWPSGVQTPAPLGHVSTAPCDVSTPGQPDRHRNWWVADTQEGKSHFLWAKCLVKNSLDDRWLVLCFCLPCKSRSTYIIYMLYTLIFLLLHLSLSHLRWGLCCEQSVPFSGGGGNSFRALLLSQQMFYCPSPMSPGQHLWVLGECSEPNCHLNWTVSSAFNALKSMQNRKVQNIAMNIKHWVNVDHFLENLDIWKQVLWQQNYMKYIIQENLPLIKVSTVI